MLNNTINNGQVPTTLANIPPCYVRSSVNLTTHMVPVLMFGYITSYKVEPSKFIVNGMKNLAINGGLNQIHKVINTGNVIRELKEFEKYSLEFRGPPMITEAVSIDIDRENDSDDCAPNKRLKIVDVRDDSSDVEEENKVTSDSGIGPEIEMEVDLISPSEEDPDADVVDLREDKKQREFEEATYKFLCEGDPEIDSLSGKIRPLSRVIQDEPEFSFQNVITKLRMLKSIISEKPLSSESPLSPLSSSVENSPDPIS